MSSSLRLLLLFWYGFRWCFLLTKSPLTLSFPLPHHLEGLQASNWTLSLPDPVLSAVNLLIQDHSASLPPSLPPKTLLALQRRRNPTAEALLEMSPLWRLQTPQQFAACWVQLFLSGFWSHYSVNALERRIWLHCLIYDSFYFFFFWRNSSFCYFPSFFFNLASLALWRNLDYQKWHIWEVYKAVK